MASTSGFPTLPKTWSPCCNLITLFLLKPDIVDSAVFILFHKQRLFPDINPPQSTKTFPPTASPKISYPDCGDNGVNEEFMDVFSSNHNFITTGALPSGVSTLKEGALRDRASSGVFA